MFYHNCIKFSSPFTPAHTNVLTAAEAFTTASLIPVLRVYLFLFLLSLIQSIIFVSIINCIYISSWLCNNNFIFIRFRCGINRCSLCKHKNSLLKIVRLLLPVIFVQSITSLFYFSFTKTVSLSLISPFIFPSLYSTFSIIKVPLPLTSKVIFCFFVIGIFTSCIIFWVINRKFPHRPMICQLLYWEQLRQQHSKRKMFLLAINNPCQYSTN